MKHDVYSDNGRDEMDQVHDKAKHNDDINPNNNEIYKILFK
jgi:hypothetical protein